MNQTLQQGLELHRGGRVSEARDCYQRAINDSPNDYVLHHALGVAYHQLGDRSLAINHLERAIALNSGAADRSQASAFHNLGVFLLQDRRLLEAESFFRRAL